MMVHAEAWRRRDFRQDLGQRHAGGKAALDDLALEGMKLGDDADRAIAGRDDFAG
jgi:hypothetical protein